MISKELAETWINEVSGFVKRLPDNSYPIWDPHVRHYEILHVGIKALKYLSTFSPLVPEQDNPCAVTWHSVLIRAENIANPLVHLLPRRTGLLTRASSAWINKQTSHGHGPTANMLMCVCWQVSVFVCVCDPTWTQLTFKSVSEKCRNRLCWPLWMFGVSHLESIRGPRLCVYVCRSHLLFGLVSFC